MAACTCYPLFYPSALIKLFKTYSEQLYLSLLYYQLEATISLSQRNIEFYNSPSARCEQNNPWTRPRGVYLEEPSLCYERRERVRNSFTEEVVRIGERLREETLETLKSLSLSLDIEVKNIVMSDCTLIKLQRPQAMYERNYLVMLASLQEQIIASSLFAKERSSSLLSLIESVQRSLVPLVDRIIERLNSSC